MLSREVKTITLRKSLLTAATKLPSGDQRGEYNPCESGKVEVTASSHVQQMDGGSRRPLRVPKNQPIAAPEASAVSLPLPLL